MEKSFKDSFAELCADRASDAVMEARGKDAEYVEAMDRLNDIRNKLVPLLDDGNEFLLNKLMDAYTCRQICETRLAYEQGMRDGLRLNQLVGV